MSEYDGINKNLEDRLHHLCESEFIASFDQMDLQTHEYMRDISEADTLVRSLEIAREDRADSNEALSTLTTHLLGKDWYGISMDAKGVREEIVYTIRKRYPAVDESPGDKWRRRHKRCKFCTHCKIVPPCDTPGYGKLFKCTIKDSIVNLNTPRPFCYMFELRKDK